MDCFLDVGSVHDVPDLQPGDTEQAFRRVPLRAVHDNAHRVGVLHLLRKVEGMSLGVGLGAVGDAQQRHALGELEGRHQACAAQLLDREHLGHVHGHEGVLVKRLVFLV